MKTALCQYCHTLSKHLKNVILSSTAPPIWGIIKNDGKSKLEIYKVYDFIKGGSCKPKLKKWTITVFSSVIDMGCVNLSTTFSLQKKYDPCKQDSFQYY